MNLLSWVLRPTSFSSSLKPFHIRFHGLMESLFRYKGEWARQAQARGFLEYNHPIPKWACGSSSYTRWVLQRYCWIPLSHEPTAFLYDISSVLDSFSSSFSRNWVDFKGEYCCVAHLYLTNQTHQVPAVSRFKSSCPTLPAKEKQKTKYDGQTIELKSCHQRIEQETFQSMLFLC